jgi:transcriptional regulator of acetoin/glycerol metabolism
VSVVNDTPLKRTLLEELREERINRDREDVEKALRHFGGNCARAAKYLGMSRPAFYRRLWKYDLAPKPKETQP